MDIYISVVEIYFVVDEQSKVSLRSEPKASGLYIKFRDWERGL